MQVVCLYFPHLKADVALMAHPDLRGHPVVLVDGPGPEARVTGRSSRAALLGVLPAMRARSARAYAPSASFLPDNSATVATALAHAADAIAEAGVGVPEVGSDFIAVHTGQYSTVDQVLSAAGLPQGVAVRVGRGASVSEALAAARAARAEDRRPPARQRLRAS